jgi:choline-sulfatase
MSKIRIALLVLFALLLLGFAYKPEAVKGLLAGRPKRLNLILIAVDTLRADHLGVYGYKRPTSPRIDEFATHGTVFETTFAPLPMTQPSFESMFTSLYPESHGIKRNDLALSPKAITLAEVLRSKGWQTAAIIGASNLDAVFGLDQGFEYYEDSLGRKVNPEVKVVDRMKRWERPAAEVNRITYDWLDHHRNGKPFFLMVHYYDPHKPYAPPAPFDTLYDRGTDEKAEWNALYDGEVTYTDQQIGLLLDRIRKMNLWDDSLILFTSDHGEGLGDHNWQTHIWKIYDEAVHIPFIAVGPGIPVGKRVPQLLSIIDFAPGILDYLNVQPLASYQGKSFLPAMNDSAKIRDFVLLEKAKPPWNFTALEPDWQKFPYSQWAVRSTDHKFLWSSDRKFEFYNLKDDPKELNNLFPGQRAQAMQFFMQASNYRGQYGRYNLGILPIRTKEGNDAEEAMRALGYLN